MRCRFPPVLALRFLKHGRFQKKKKKKIHFAEMQRWAGAKWLRCKRCLIKSNKMKEMRKKKKKRGIKPMVARARAGEGEGEGS